MDDRVELRPARVSESGRLSDLAMRAKAHWGYDQEFLEACRDELTVQPSQVESGRVAVAVRGEAVVGFSVVEVRGRMAELLDLFVEPSEIRTGVGRALFGDAVEAARGAGCEQLRIEADPNAVPFYRSLGAREVGEAPSGSIDHRMLPVMEVDLDEAGTVA